MMSTTLADAERFRAWTAEHLGLSFDDEKLSFLSTLIEERTMQRGVSVNDYLNSIDETPEERKQLITALTVPETYFFRHTDQFEAFTGVALPWALAAAGAAGKVRILCAGCASGEEAYSLVMWMRQHEVDLSRIAPTRAVDLNPAMLRKAKAARYSPWALRSTPALALSRWFSQEGNDHVLSDSIRADVEFEELNLADRDSAWWKSKTFDIIFCRNVLMYFTRDAALEAIDRLAGVLTPGGYLFLGHAETLRDRSDDFELCNSHGAFYYRLGSEIERPVPSAPSPPSRELGGRSAQRVVKQADPPALERLDLKNPLARETNGTQALQKAWGLLAEERFAEAIGALESIPAVEQDQEIRSMRAALLVHAGRLADAERECAAILRLNARDAGAHYLLALCRDGAKDRIGAVHHDLEAIDIAPHFALPPLHLGLMARSVGDSEEAARHFDTALGLLQTDDRDRLLLFGGGFSRTALISVCRACSSSGQRRMQK